MSDEVKAKGLSFVYFKEYVTGKDGQSFWQRFLEKLEPGPVETWSNPLLSIWYPFSHFKAGFFLYAELQGAAQRERLPEIYEYIADKSLNTIYKIFFKVTGSPTFVLKNYPKLWSLFFNTGKVEVLETGDNTCTFQFTLPEIFLDWLHPACTGFTRKAVTLAGGFNVVVKEVNRDQEGGLHQITYVTQWES